VVAAARALGVEVRSVPGPCAATAAVSVSGLDARAFAFHAFPPRENKARAGFLERVIRQQAFQPMPAVLYESPFRVVALLEAIATRQPDSRVSVSNDLTKLHERTDAGTAAVVLAVLRANAKADKGEYALVWQPQAEPQQQPATPSAEARLLEHMLHGASLRDARDALTAEGCPRNDAYKAALNVREFLEGLHGA